MALQKTEFDSKWQLPKKILKLFCEISYHHDHDDGKTKQSKKF